MTADIKVFKWEEVKSKFNDTLIIGNGASIAVHKEFGYTSLLDSARENGFISKKVDKIFKYLNTSDFELVLKILWYAYHVNRALNIHDDCTKKVYLDTRDALIKCVSSNHVKYVDCFDHLDQIADFMKGFNKVFCLNYDLVTYWAMMVGNDEQRNWFKDCFKSSRFCDNWAEFRDLSKAEGKTLVFYPHGNLCLANEIGKGEVKIQSGPSQDLLKNIICKWEENKCIPIFVSEGTSQQKREAIGRSNYLNTVYKDALPGIRKNMFCYGWSMDENDEHILEKIPRHVIDTIGVSVYKGGKSCSEFQKECEKWDNKLKEKFPEAKERLLVESTSPGCWNN